MNKPNQRLLVRVYVVAGFAFGIALTIWVVRRSGVSLDWTSLLASWPVLLAATCWFMIPLMAAAQSWRYLFRPAYRPDAGRLLALTWIGLGVNWLLPVATLGGEVVRFRLGLLAGWPARRLAASLVVDKTMLMATQIVLMFLGAGLLAALTGTLDWHLSSVVGLAGLIVTFILFYRAQHAGLFSGLAAGLARVSTRQTRAGLKVRQIDAAIRRVYKSRSDMFRALGWRMLFRVAMAGEVVLVLGWFDPSLAGGWQWLAAALVLESLAQGARALAFFIPAGIGAQEGALIGAGLLLGIPTEAVMLVAVVKRGREILVGGSALLAWQLGEAWRWGRTPQPGPGH